jgi:hypothetical protein
MAPSMFPYPPVRFWIRIIGAAIYGRPQSAAAADRSTIRAAGW